MVTMAVFIKEMVASMLDCAHAISKNSVQLFGTSHSRHMVEASVGLHRKT
jgi:hypothetical protein